MFCSGIVKLSSRCPTWWGLTALDWHYESQVRTASVHTAFIWEKKFTVFLLIVEQYYMHSTTPKNVSH